MTAKSGGIARVFSGPRLKTERRKLKKGQEWLAKKCGVTAQDVKDWEGGALFPTPESIPIIEGIFKVKFSYFTDLV